MAIVGDELWLEFSGGLRTSLDPTRIADNELSDGSNFLVRDGTARLDRRYKQMFDQSGVASRDPQGSGWGRFDDDEQYCLVLDNSMYLVDLTTTYDFTAVLGATNLAEGNWWFNQFGEFMYAGNRTDGLGRKKLAAGNDGTGDWALLRRPTAPSAAPTATFHVPHYVTADFTGSTLTATGNSANSQQTNGGWRVSYNNSGTAARQVTVTFDTSPVDLRPDWEYRDILQFNLPLWPSSMELPRVTIVEGSNETQALAWLEARGPTSATIHVRMQNIARANRNAVTAVRFDFTTPAGLVTVQFDPPFAVGVWLSLDSQVAVGVNEMPPLKDLKYVTTYFNDTTDFESPPSPEATIPAISQSIYGQWEDVTFLTTNEAGVSHVRLYRVVEEGGTKRYYRLHEAQNTGSSVTHVDKLPVDMVKALPAMTPSILPRYVDSICSWQNRQVILGRAEGETTGFARLVYISRDAQDENDEISFEPYSAAYDPTDPGRGLTFYPDDARAETGYAVIGQDDLYIVMDRSVRCLFGNSPDNWRLIKLPDLEGACGPRACCAYKKGILLLTPSGRLLYHHSSLMEPVDVAEGLRPRIGDPGLKALANADCVVQVSPEGEIEVRSAGDYFIMDPEGGWRKGRHTHPTHSCLFISGLPIRFVGTNGRIYEGGDDSYVSDGGTTGTNGDAVTWHVVTGKKRMPRASTGNINWGETTQTLDPQDTKKCLYPVLTIHTQRFPEGRAYRPKYGRQNSHPNFNNADEKLMFRIDGDKDTVVPECRIELQPVAKARHK